MDTDPPTHARQMTRVQFQSAKRAALAAIVRAGIATRDERDLAAAIARNPKQETSRK